MNAHNRSLAPSVSQLYHSRFKNLLVSGCSYTFNNSNNHVCTWPYYLRDVAGFKQVFDCSQSGAGSNHIFNSIIYETETNVALSPHDTLVIVMWSGLSRHDIVATTDITSQWHHMSNYKFNQDFATLSIFADTNGNSMLDKLCQQYWKIIDFKCQILESVFKIIALKSQLSQKGYHSVFLSWKPIQSELECAVESNLQQKVLTCFEQIKSLDEYAEITNQRIPNDGHPNTEAHLEWVRLHLAPYLENKKLLLPL